MGLRCKKEQTDAYVPSRVLAILHHLPHQVDIAGESFHSATRSHAERATRACHGYELARTLERTQVHRHHSLSCIDVQDTVARPPTMPACDLRPCKEGALLHGEDERYHRVSLPGFVSLREGGMGDFSLPKRYHRRVYACGGRGSLGSEGSYCRLHQ